MAFVKHSIFLIGQERQRSSNKSRGRTKKNRSTGRLQDEKATHGQLCKKFPVMSLLLQLLSESLKMPGSAARAALPELFSEGLIKVPSKHRAQSFTPEHKGWGCPSCWQGCLIGPINCTFGEIKLH